jgi:hypothetical protein
MTLVGHGSSCGEEAGVDEDGEPRAPLSIPSSSSINTIQYSQLSLHNIASARFRSEIVCPNLERQEDALIILKHSKSKP